MFKKTVKYVDLANQQQEETLYFNYTAPQLIELLSQYGVEPEDVQKYVSKLTADGDTAGMIKFIHDLIAKAYGERSDDNKRFVKSEQITKDFEDSLAFDQLFMDFLQNPKEFEGFIEATTQGIQAFGEQQVGQPQAKPNIHAVNNTKKRKNRNR